MTSALEPRRPLGTVVHEADVRPKAPPMLAVGPLAWLRENLFKTPFDTALTVIAGAIAAFSLVNIIGWAVGEANWYAITFNLRLLMVGRFQSEYEWRLVVLLVVTCAAVGMALAAWLRLRRWVVIAAAAILAVLFFVPPIVSSLIPLPPAYLGAGSVQFGSGPTAVRPLERVGFIARAGEEVRVQIESRFTISPEALRELHSFGDDIAGLLVNTTNQRFEGGRRLAEIDALFTSGALTANQTRILEAERSRITIPDEVLQAQRVNAEPVTVRILDGVTLEPLGEAALALGSEALVVMLPQDGWFVLEQQMAADDSVALLETYGIYPILERNITRRADSGRIESIDQYVRMTDFFLSEAARPDFDGRDVPFTVTTELPYRGQHTFADYLRLYLAPFMTALSTPFLVIALSAAGGYLLARLLDRLLSPPENPRRTSSQAARWSLLSIPVLMFVLVYGFPGIVPLTDPRTWGGLLLTILLTVWGIVISLPLGILLALGRQSEAGVPLTPLLHLKVGGERVPFQPKLRIVSLLSTVYIELIRGVPFITVLFMAQLLLPLVNPSLADFPGAFRATIATVMFSAAYLAETVRGGLQAIPPGQVEAAKALGLSGWQVTMQVVLPQALRIVIPAIMGSFVALFKDTSLVTIVGLLDLTGMADNVNAQTEFLGLRRETLFFISIIYFVFCWGMAAVSRRLETTGAGSAMQRQI